ncbi:class E sortase [Streptomyces sp. NPDC049837]|uniref:class E sortase n=1 Tax=Streptomyces sp. NPDC049837 TaxID=3155277 RepID=UPI0034212DCA
MRERIPVVVRQRQGGWRGTLARGVWVGAEILVTVGVVLMLLVVHQFWWTNQQARAGAQRQVHALEREWGGRAVVRPPAPSPSVVGGGEEGESGGRASGGAARPTVRQPPAYAILRIPALRLAVPIGRGVGKPLLDKGYAGHYPGTAQPGQAGNFALAGHRNTHGEPFRHINRLRKGDEIIVETRDGVFTYVVDRTLARTSPRDTAAIAPVPKGYSEPGYYVTLTTCTPEYSSAYRLIVWGELRSMRPR